MYSFTNRCLVRGMGVFLTLNCHVTATSSTISVRADSLLLSIEMQALWLQNYDRHYSTLLCSKQSRQCNTISSYWIRQARHTNSTKERNIERNKEKQIENKNKKCVEVSQKEMRQTIKHYSKCSFPYNATHQYSASLYLQRSVAKHACIRPHAGYFSTAVTAVCTPSGMYTPVGLWLSLQESVFSRISTFIFSELFFLAPFFYTHQNFLILFCSEFVHGISISRYSALCQISQVCDRTPPYLDTKVHILQNSPNWNFWEKKISPITTALIRTTTYNHCSTIPRCCFSEARMHPDSVSFRPWCLKATTRPEP